jgi:hypothetical protein
MTGHGADRQSTFILPHFEFEVPLLLGADGLHYVPLFVLCRLLGLDAARELRRAQQVLLWSSARLFLVDWKGGTRFAWCHTYPWGIASWLSMVERKRIQDPARRAQLDRTVKDGIELGGRATELVKARFERGRRRMYQLSERMQALGTVLAHYQGHRPWEPVEAQARLDQLTHRHRALADQVQLFVQAWLADKAQLPVIDAISVDGAGQVSDELVPITLFGTINAQDEARLGDYEQAYSVLVTDLIEWQRDLE